MDVSCCKRKVITAVKELIDCGLVVKKCRRNRTNVYLIYPPEYYNKKKMSSNGPAAENEEFDDEAEFNTDDFFENNLLPEEGGVHDMHPEGAPHAPPPEKITLIKKNIGSDPRDPVQRVGGAPHAPGGASPALRGAPHAPRGAPHARGGCMRGTQGVHVVHPKSTNIINKVKLTLKEPGEDEVRIIYEKKFLAEEIEQTKNTFKSKGVQVTDKMIKDLLKTYDARAVQAAITSCDFRQARNPLAVIKWMLQTGNYVMPVERAPVVVDEAPPPLDPAQDEVIKKLISQAKAGLQRKRIPSATPEPVQFFSMR